MHQKGISIFFATLIALLFLLPCPQGCEASPAAALPQGNGAPGADAGQSVQDVAGSTPARQEGYFLPVVFNDRVEAFVQYFLTRERTTFQKWLNRSSRNLPIMQDIFRMQGLPEDLVYVSMIESGFRTGAVSRARAVGPWQFMPATARRYGLRVDGWVDERKDVIKSTQAAAKYLRDCFERFGSWPLALAAYNAGIGKVERAVAKQASPDFWDLRPSSALRRETREFVPKFLAALIIARDPAAYGFSVPRSDEVRFAVVTVPERTYLRRIAQYADTPPEIITALNPQFLRGATPPRIFSAIRIPEGKRKLFLQRMQTFRGCLKDNAPTTASMFQSVTSVDMMTESSARLDAAYSYSKSDAELPIGAWCGTDEGYRQPAMLAGEPTRYRRNEILRLP